MDELKTEEQVETTPVQEEVQSSDVETSEAESPQEQPVQQEVTSSEKGETETKTRLEKRIESLEEKLQVAPTQKDKEKISSLIDRLKGKMDVAPMPNIYETEPLIKDDELTTGVDPKDLEARQRRREMALKEQVKAEIFAQNQFTGKVRDHLTDVEQTIANTEELQSKSAKHDKDLEDFINKQYWLANNVFNPMTNSYEFVPTVKYSEIVKQVQKVIDKKITRATAETSAKIQDDVSLSGIPPSSRSESGSDLESEALFAKAKETGSDEDWAALIKKRLNLKS